MDREALQIAQARIAGAEIVDRQLHTELCQGLQQRQRFLGVLDQDRFGQLEFEQRGRQVGLAQRCRHAFDEARLLELQRRDIDRDPQDQPLCVPPRCLLDGLAQHPFADRDDEAALFGHRDEVGRRDVAELGVAPAQQRLGAAHHAAAQFDLRLVVQLEAPLRQRLPHRVVEPHAGQ